MFRLTCGRRHLSGHSARARSGPPPTPFGQNLEGEGAKGAQCTTPARALPGIQSWGNNQVAMGRGTDEQGSRSKVADTLSEYL